MCADKFEEMIVGCDFVEYFFATLLTAVFNHISLVFTVIDADRIHLAGAKRRPVPRMHVVDMTGTETKRTVIPGGSFRMWEN